MTTSQLIAQNWLYSQFHIVIGINQQTDFNQTD